MYFYVTVEDMRVMSSPFKMFFNNPSMLPNDLYILNT